MAGSSGKQTRSQQSRQKMINMMYLVFIAMLALNISKEVLTTLGIIDEDLIKSTATNEVRVDEYYNQIFSSEEVVFAIPSEELPKLKELTDNYYNFLQSLKDSLMNTDEDNYNMELSYKNENGETDKIIRRNYELMDKTNYFDEMFLDGDTPTSIGQQYIDTFKDFPNKVLEILDSISVRSGRDASVNKEYNFDKTLTNLYTRFNYPADDIVIDNNGVGESWLKYNYEKFPLIAGMVKMTKIQSDIRNVELDILSAIIGDALGVKIDVNRKSTLLEADRPAFYTNDIVDARIVVGNTDATFKPTDVELFVDGVKLSDSEYDFQSGGGVTLNKRFNTEGEKKLTGLLIFSDKNGKSDSLRVDSRFFVIRKPNKAVVSPVNMQVFYIGLRNEIEVAFPGVADLTSINVSAVNGTIINQSGKYYASPDEGAESMDVIVTGRANDENVTSVIPFDVAESPAGSGSVTKTAGGTKRTFDNKNSLILKRLLIGGTVEGLKPAGFLYDYNIEVNEFEIKVGLFTAKKVTGNKIQGQEVLSNINSAATGTSVKIKILSATKIDGDFESPTEVEDINLTLN